MSKIGGWHTCYNSDRAISNELGGKWELFYQETFETTHSEGYEFPHDLDENETPLNLNGVMIILDRKSTTESVEITITINGTSFTTTIGASSRRTMYFNVDCKNGHLNNRFVITSPTSSATPYSNQQLNQLFVEKINSFGLAVTNVEKDSIVKFYVLRGV